MTEPGKVATINKYSHEHAPTFAADARLGSSAATPRPPARPGPEGTHLGSFKKGLIEFSVYQAGTDPTAYRVYCDSTAEFYEACRFADAAEAVPVWEFSWKHNAWRHEVLNRSREIIALPART